MKKQIFYFIIILVIIFLLPKEMLMDILCISIIGIICTLVGALLLSAIYGDKFKLFTISDTESSSKSGNDSINTSSNNTPSTNASSKTPSSNTTSSSNTPSIGNKEEPYYPTGVSSKYTGNSTYYIDDLYNSATDVNKVERQLGESDYHGYDTTSTFMDNLVGKPYNYDVVNEYFKAPDYEDSFADIGLARSQKRLLHHNDVMRENESKFQPHKFAPYFGDEMDISYNKVWWGVDN